MLASSSLLETFAGNDGPLQHLKHQYPDLGGEEDHEQDEVQDRPSASCGASHRQPSPFTSSAN